MKSGHSDEHLRVDHLKNNLRARSVRGGAIVFTSQGVKFVLQTGATLVLARLLLPTDFGLIAMVTAVTGFVALFQDLGLSLATIQRTNITLPQINALFWINVAAGLLLTLLSMAIAPALAWFYHEPRLTWIAMLISAGFLMSGLSAQHIALLRRQMRFGVLAVIDIAAVTAQVVTGILSAWWGAGYWSLVWMTLAGSGTNLIFAWSLSRWRPRAFPRHEPLRQLLSFGSHITGFNVVNYFARNLDNILIGRCWGPQILGFYSKAYNLLLLPLNQINAPFAGVATAAMSRLQDDPRRLREYFLKVLSLVLLLVMPIAVISFVLSEQIVRLVLGPQWMEAVPIFRLLAISAAVQPIVNTAGWLYIATGQTRRMLKWGIFASSLIVSSFLIGLPYGAQGVAFAYSSVMVLLSAPCVWYATLDTQITLRDVAFTAAHPFFAAAFAGATCFAEAHFIRSLPELYQALICVPSMLLLYGALMLVSRRKRYFYWSLVKEFRRHRP